MKTKISRFSKSVLSVILAMTLIMSTMLIGTITVNASVTTLYVIGDAVSQGNWSKWKELSSKTADNTIAYTTINGNQAFKVSTAEDWNKYEGISLDNSLGDVNINGEFSDSSNLSTKDTIPTIYICVRLKDGHIYASTTKPSSGGSESNTELYVLSQYSSDVNLYTFNRNNFTPKDSSLTSNGYLPMNMVASFQNGSNTYYLWKVSYTGTCKFIVYCKSDSDSGNWFDNKLTNDIDGSKYTTTSYYFDLKGIEKTSSPSVKSETTTPFISLESAEFTSAATSFEAGVVNLTTEFPVASATNTLSAYNTVSYYVDDTLVSDPTNWNATAGNHSVYAVINSGKKSGETTAYQSAQTDTRNFTVSSTVATHTVTLGTYDNGKVELVSDSPAKVGSSFDFKVKANDNYVIDTVSLSDGTEVTAGITDDAGYTHYTFTMPNADVTINATFRSTATPTQKFYFEYYTSGHNTAEMTYNNGSYSYETHFDYGNFKFRITSLAKDETGFDPNKASDSVSAYKRNKGEESKKYVFVTASGVQLVTEPDALGSNSSYGVTEFADIMLTGIDTSKTYVVTYKPGDDNILNGTITVSDKSVTPTLATPKIKGDSAVLPGSTITVALDNQKDFGTDTDGDKVFVANDDSIKFAYTVTASDNSIVAFTESASGKITKADGTAINDKISFTASNSNGVTYTITCKVSADNFADVTSSELTVKVGTIPFAQSDRIYAYAKTLGADETPALNAWVASETNASKLDTHIDNGTVKPTLGKTSDTDIRIFLPTTASSTKVVLYNSFSSNINVKDKDGNYVTITAGDYAEVSYTPNASTTVKSVDSSFSDKTLTIYKSTADGALYVNNTGEFASIDDNGALSMINKLYSDKETGEIAAGNAGALADANGVKDVAVKKIKGRGNSTWRSANKKSFNVTFDANINAFGFEKGKKFSLLANFKDPSLSRNKILYELADLMGVKYSPDAATVDLYMNGLYMGSYLMCQKVDVGSKELVNDLGKTLLEDLYTDKEAGKVPDTSASAIREKGFSFLMELDSNADTGDFYTTVDGQKITIKEPEYLKEDGSIPTDAVTQAAIKFVEDKYKDLNTAMSNTSITLEQLNNIIDVESLAKYYLVNEIAKNYDIGVSSTYLVYKLTVDSTTGEVTGGKFYISPLWDMDVTTGNCKATDTNYQSYEGNWTDNNSSYNLFMKKVFANPQVQSAARKLWTNSYYTTLTGYIDTLTTKATNVEGSLNCNYTKWNYPYEFQGEYDDNVQARTSLKKATYNPSDNTYTVASSSTSYETTAVGQTQYVSDWLKSRVAWMSHKYNTYTLTGLNGWDSDVAVTKSSDNGVTTWKITGASKTEFKISTDGYAGKDSTHSCINYDPSVNIVNKSSKATISAASGTDKNFGFASSGTISESSPVYLIYNQKTNTLTLSDSESTSTNPSVRLKGSDVAKNEDIKDGTAVTLTATITPATSNNAVVTGDYTATLYIGEKKVTAKTVTFTAADDTKDVVFDTYLEGTNQTYKVAVTCNDGEQDRTGTSNPFTYKQTGIKDQKIYFDPSTHTATVGSNTVYDWLDKTTLDSVVTVTLSDSTTFKMYIDSDDVHGLDKGVFRADIDEETLEKLKTDSNITFSMDGTSLTCSVAGQSDITSGWIYNYSSQEGQALWEQYNVSYEEAYPGGCTTYAQFKDYLANQATDDTDHIVYFDNSASKFYNVYIYCWETAETSEHGKNAVLMKKLPYADIWYYDFGSNMPAKDFLFKDRSNAGFGNNYQQTVDLVGKNDPSDLDQCVPDGNDTWIPLNFEATITTPNPIFITQNFYKVKEKGGSGSLKFRAFNTQWQEFSAVVKSEVQTKAVDVYFDLHNKTATDIQLYHSSTSNNYSFATKFTRLTPLPGSTIYHSTIMLPYTDNGIAFKFDKFIVDYSDGSTKTCKMSDKVQPTFTCINTGEVWYEINSDFASVDYDTSASSASLLKANSPSLTAATEYKDVYLTGNMNGWVTKDSEWQLSSTDGNKYTRTFVYDGSKGNINFKVYFAEDRADNKYFTKEGGSGNFTFNSSTTFAQNLINPAGEGNHMTIEPISNTGQVLLNVTVYKSYDDGTSQNVKRLEITQSVVKDYYVADDPIKKSPFTGSEEKMSKNDSGVYYYHFTDIVAGDYNFKITDGIDNWDVANWNSYSSDKSSLTNITVANSGSYDKIKVTLSKQTSFTVYYDGTNVYIIEDSSAPTPKLTLSAINNTITLNNGTATTNLSVKTENVPYGTAVDYVITPESGATVADNLFTATVAGTYKVKAKVTVGGKEYSSNEVTITVNEESTEPDYCGILAYNHSTATFDVTGGGTIDKTDVVLTNGYYTTGNVTTGYTSYDGTTYTVIYALPSTGKTDASTSYSSETSHSNEGTGEGNYSFDGWTKDGVVKTDTPTLTDSISGTATVAYVANWSQEVMVTYTFTYVYDMYDTKTNGKEYHENGALTKNSDYKVQVSLSVNATKPDVIAAYLANAPKISSDYFTYTFDDTDVAISTDLTNHTAEATAKIASIKKYKVTFNNEDGIVSADEYFYQNIVKLTQSAPSGYVTVWKDEKGNTLYVGDSYSFRITRNIIIESKSVTSSSLKPATYVNEPTYEFFTSGTTEYVKFKVRVDNVLAGVTPDEYGTLYFFTDENGVPVDSTISVDSNIDSDKLTAAALGSASTGIKKYNATDIVNADHKFIYAPYIKNTAANRDRYLRVYSYYIYKDEEGNDVVVISSDSVLASIRNALNES